MKGKNMEKPLRVYWAGDLFNFKDLLGNLQLARAVEKASGGKYAVFLPQDGEANHTRTTSIRDQDLLNVINADLLIANFDGCDLDSGTVVEFMVAKMLDIPALLLRTDFRIAGDQSQGADHWNLMCSHYPRSRTLQLDAMRLYAAARAEGRGPEGVTAGFLAALTREITANLETLLAEKPVFPADADYLRAMYRHVITACGAGLAAHFPDAEIEKIVRWRLGE